MHKNSCYRKTKTKTPKKALLLLLSTTIALTITALLVFPTTQTASAFQRKSLRLYNSAPSAISKYELEFTSTTIITPSSKITIELASEVGSPPAFGANDTTIKLDDVAQTTAASSNATTFGIANNGPDSILITTPSALTIASGTVFKILMGTQDNMINPPAPGSYKVTIAAVTSTNVPLESGSALFPVINAVQSIAIVADPNAPPGGGRRRRRIHPSPTTPTTSRTNLPTSNSPTATNLPNNPKTKTNPAKITMSTRPKRRPNNKSIRRNHPLLRLRKTKHKQTDRLLQ